MKRSLLGFCILWFFIALAPTSSIFPIADLAFEHRMYLPLAPVIFLLVLLALRFKYQVRPISLIVACTVLAGVTMARNMDYKTEVALWSDTIRKRPDNLRAYRARGKVLMEAGLYARALNDLNVAVMRELSPENLNERGSAFFRLNRYDEALDDFTRAIQMADGFLPAHYNRAMLYLATNQIPLAMHDLNRCLQIDPRHAQSYLGRAKVWARSGKANNAQADLETCRALGMQISEPERNQILSGLSPLN